MKRTLFIFACMLTSLTMPAQESDTNDSDYLPFVDAGKSWFVASSTPGQDAIDKVGYYIPLGIEEVNEDGKAYYKMKAFTNNTTETGTYLIREEDRKVYLFDTDTQKEYLMFDYFLKAGDTYDTYSSEYQRMVRYEVFSVGDYTEGPKILSSYYDEKGDSMAVHYRYLRKWVVQSDIEKELCLAPKTWIEGVGSLEGPFANLYDTSSSLDHLAYVLYNGESYLPFTFNESIGKLWFGCNLPKTASYIPEDWHSQLTYELEDNRLHVYGQLVLNCGCYNYVYFTEELTDNPLVHKLHFEIQNVGEEATCVNLFDTDFYVPGFDPNMNYIVIDSDGEEHPVINKTPQNEYRPFVEEGKVWQVGAEGSGNPVQIVEYYYFDGDTIIDGKACKQMMCQWYVSPNHPYYGEMSQLPSLSYEGAWYEENKKVYTYDVTNKQFILMYDFSADANDTIQINNCQFVIGPKQTGGIKGFKGVYQDVRRCENGGSSYSPTWMEGVGSIDGPTKNVHYVDEVPTWFLMACAVDDEVIYLNDEYEDGATPENMGAQKRRFDFTHTVKTQPKVPMRREAEQSLYGEFNDKLLGINLDPVDDAYLVRITDETGKVVYEKAIDAGNIVALNVDISSYAIGRYTVTVENSQESFTGEFETQTTGIEEICSKRSEVRDYIYNLQGQRLTSLQKGLNIVNGKKVYVK